MDSNINQTLKLGSHIQNPRWICILVIKLVQYDKLKNRADGNNGQILLKATIIKRLGHGHESIINAPKVWPLIIFTNQFKQKDIILVKSN